MKIGNVEIDNPIFLAPMAGITDGAFRILCREMGAGLVVTEMVSGKGLYYNDEKTQSLTKINLRERPVALQIFGSEPLIMSKVVEKYVNPREDIDILDINMGCPAPKIVKNGDGSALLKSPSLVKKIVKEIVKVSTKPVTVKIRTGWDSSSINALEISKILEAEGVSAITIHGRTREMFYTGDADWEIIKEVKDHVNIPVIGNGDLFTSEDVYNIFKYTGCDGIAIGRGSRGNPWIFKESIDLLKGETVSYPTKEEKLNMIIKHLDLISCIKGEKIGVKEMRKHIAWYVKGMENSASFKNEINKIESRKEMENVLYRYFRNT
ncbi:MAG TPA: tRNA dihydrouridine synthase DusB [Tissierellales bacterium]|nr:tRNA dihydrouridine synthase DusB [Tissierellales bacterium]